ncbi:MULTISPECIES: hypothetical protein [unclassified Nostoc]|uniref:hypothetical protein n=1 Tax=unclassified Nostoc TaxID=2593658 RepID=UPI0025AAC13C|nr:MULTISPECIES: hypothetical protein [unclassified Nostoc]MDM9581501.1 hypothetical protein [Nostoc sp. GT001]MDZ7948376.1 hypothetical protein [Nostoc sp. EfeVER01]MDZ7995352.1 hypothetical protein [Nostoc sp. EspVER01]
MPRQKRTYRVLEKAELRMSGLKAIDPSMDFGDARNLQNITQIIQQYRSKIEAYNTTLALIDSYKNEMKDLETTLSDLTEKMLLGVAFKYGKDSYEYQMAGGVRKSDRIRKSTATRLKATSEEVNTKSATTV